jgi:hypothetical protein
MISGKTAVVNFAIVFLQQLLLNGFFSRTGSAATA